ncbi:MAG: PIN domain-containing protein [Candidatus Eremiobacteraeota bacterium]|nr:PIN domain-containing protein [Candidatus Eremiobacteraeota bacterium]MBC5803283.1 PIN domain-containing protein [Candidatus Eremiobacteraeota bacterium]MBC5822189.1 PIN domain-containing protein [Candidatus Eremiobacteraeota bacterium]
MRAALDSNVLAYAEGVNDAARQKTALMLVRAVSEDAIVVPVQALGELFHVLVRKAKRSRDSARAAILSWRDAFPCIETSGAAMVAAADLSAAHDLGIWDAVILSVSAAAGCRLLLSEDFHEGFTWSGVTVVNPFAKSRHILLESLLDG